MRQTLRLFFLIAWGAQALAQTASPSPPSEPPAAPVISSEAETGAEGASGAGESVSETPPPVLPAARTSLLKSTKDAAYTKPLLFDPAEAGALLPPPEIDYDLSQDGGKTLRIGNIRLGEKTLIFALRSLSSFQPRLSELAGEEAQHPALVMVWPTALLRRGTLEMISRSGQVIWSYEITEQALSAWTAKQAGWRAKLRERGVSAKDLERGVFRASFAIRDLRERSSPLLRNLDSFRFCLSQNEGKLQTRLCSERFATRVTGSQIVMSRAASAASPRVVVMKENGALRGTVPVPADALAQFYADLATGQSYEFLALAPKLDLVDLSDTSKPGLLRVSGFGVAPTSAHAILNPKKFGALTTMLGFEPTIGHDRVYWGAGLRVEDPVLYFPGTGGGVFKQRFQLADVPRSAARPHFEATTKTGTYSSEPTIHGRKQADSQVSSEQNAAKPEAADPTKFSWDFRASEKGAINRSFMSVTYEGKVYKGFYEIYRSYANELSGRFSAVGSLGSSNLLLVGELAYNHWFENWFGWDNYYVTQQRWGASFKYFKSLTKVKTGTDKTTGEDKQASLDVMALDLKYRFSPGLWTFDESVGLIGSYQNVTFDVVKAPMLGVGAFWARSMPRSLNEFFNAFPLMDAPKWVDMEFIYYAASMKSDVKLNNTMALNFHGQVLWRKNLFGEAGFGFKRYGFVDSGQSLAATLDTFYATWGLGIKF